MLLLFSGVVGTLFGLLVSRLLPSIFELRVLFVALVFALLAIGLVLLVQAIRKLMDSNR